MAGKRVLVKPIGRLWDCKMEMFGGVQGETELDEGETGYNVEAIPYGRKHGVMKMFKDRYYAEKWAREMVEKGHAVAIFKTKGKANKWDKMASADRGRFSGRRPSNNFLSQMGLR
jgi:hypothetical protein